MKSRFFKLVPQFVVGTLILSSCGTANFAEGLDAIENTFEKSFDGALQFVEIANDPVPMVENNVMNTSVPSIPAMQLTAPVKLAHAKDAKAYITQAKAEEIALARAETTKEQVVRFHTEFDHDDGIPTYEVEFYKDNYEYDIDIHAESGEILWYDVDIGEPKAAKPADKPLAVDSAKDTITKEKAQALALAHAELAEDDVVRLRVEFDYDDGVPTYEVEFRKGNMEYDVDIHAATGKILSYEAEVDD